MRRSWIVALLLVPIFGLLWYLNRHTVSTISFNDKKLIIQNGRCHLMWPLKNFYNEHFTADVLTIERTIATLENGDRIVDERVTMPANNTFGMAVSAVISHIFKLRHIETIERNLKMELFKATTPSDETFYILAIFKGKSDPEMLYPLSDKLIASLQRCLFGKDITLQPTDRENDAGQLSMLPLSEWNQKLFELDIIVNKDM